MILAVSGWRHWTDHEFIGTQLIKMQDRGYTRLRVGDAQGADSQAWHLAIHTWPVVHKFRADWYRLGKKAGYQRNHAMLIGDFTTARSHNAHPTQPGVPADMLLAFPQPGKRRLGSGTWLCIDQAFELGITVEIPGQKGLTL